METSIGKPYSEERFDNRIKRIFDQSVAEEELIWHRDRKDRYVTVKEANGWKLQLDNQLPIHLEENESYFIKAEVYHRLLKGNGNLVIEIREE